MNKRLLKDLLYEQVARIGKAASSPKRLELLELLAQGEKTVESLASELSADIKLTCAHLPFARSMPVAEIEQRLAELPSDIEIVAYCRGPFCLLSDEAVALLTAKGYRVRKILDGVSEWQAAGFPVEQPES